MATLTLQVMGGLCSRLRAVACALAYCQKVGKSLNVDWPTSEPSEPLRAFQCRLSELWDLPVHEMHLPRRAQKDTSVLQSSDSAHLRTCHIEPFLPWIGSVGLAFNALHPTANLHAVIDSVRMPAGKFVTGVNVRFAQKDPRTVGTEWFLDRLDAMDVDAVFLATDATPVTEAFRHRFGDRLLCFKRTVVPRTNGWYKYDRDSIIKQAAELYLLANCSYVIGSNHSSMSQTVAFIRGATYRGSHEKPGGLGNLKAARYCDAWNQLDE